MEPAEAYLLAVNLAALLAFGIDKRRAVRGRRRVPEARLLLLAAAGGAAGAWLGVAAFRHKTRKLGFLTLLALATAAAVAVALFAAAP